MQTPTYTITHIYAWTYVHMDTLITYWNFHQILETKRGHVFKHVTFVKYCVVEAEFLKQGAIFHASCGHVISEIWSYHVIWHSIENVYIFYLKYNNLNNVMERISNYSDTQRGTTYSHKYPVKGTIYNSTTLCLLSIMPISKTKKLCIK